LVAGWERLDVEVVRGRRGYTVDTSSAMSYID
jgi:hypothetical protein